MNNVRWYFLNIWKKNDEIIQINVRSKNWQGIVYLAVEAIASCASGGSADDGTGKQ